MLAQRQVAGLGCLAPAAVAAAGGRQAAGAGSTALQCSAQLLGWAGKLHEHPAGSLGCRRQTPSVHTDMPALHELGRGPLGRGGALLAKKLHLRSQSTHLVLLPACRLGRGRLCSRTLVHESGKTGQPLSLGAIEWRAALLGECCSRLPAPDPEEPLLQWPGRGRPGQPSCEERDDGAADWQSMITPNLHCSKAKQIAERLHSPLPRGLRPTALWSHWAAQLAGDRSVSTHRHPS